MRVLSAALMAAVVLIGIALAFVVGGSEKNRQGQVVHTHAPGLWMYVVILAVGAIAAIVVQVFGYRIPALSPDLEPAAARTAALQRYQQTMILRFALSESVAIIAIALLFSGHSNTILPYVLAAVVAELLMAYHVWPSRNLIERVQRRLIRNGAQFNLANALNGSE